MVEEVRMFPRWFYKQGEEPRLVASEEEAQALGEGWSDETPVPGAVPPTQRTPPVPPAESAEGDEEEHEGSPRRRR